MIADKITMLAPVVPFRGGIAQHSSMLANALAEICEMRVYSYERLYPEWLYPGSATKEPETLRPLDIPVDYIVDSLNPVSWRKAAHRIAGDAPAAIILPWWTAVLGPFYIYLAHALRRYGVPLVFFCHNVTDHESAWWKQRMAKTVLKQGDMFIVQTRGEHQRLRKLLGDRYVIRHPHPVYSQFPEPERKLPRRASVELLFFGAIRHYKGVDILIRALAKIRDVSWHLSIVGESWWKEGENISKLLDELALRQNVETVFRYVTDREAANYFARADAVVLPYRSATGTGVIAAAYHYKKPVIASRVGGLPDITVEGMNALLVPKEDPQQLASAIREFARHGLPNTETTISNLLADMTWERLAQQIAAGIENLRGSSI